MEGKLEITAIKYPKMLKPGRKKKHTHTHCDGGEQMKQKCGKTEIYAFLVFFFNLTLFMELKSFCKL